MSHHILVADDDPVQRRLLSASLAKLGYKVSLAENGQEALNIIASKEGTTLKAVLLDLVMPELDGMGVLEALKHKKNTLPIIVQTSKGGIDTVINAMRMGACDFVVKPASIERLQISLQNALKMEVLEEAVSRIHKSKEGLLSFKDLISKAPAMERVINLGTRAAKSHIPVLLEGESGVGKELFARAIQGTSQRKAKPFITVNCGAIPENLVESILFGHEKGAFTGANDKHIGKFQEAHNGTLFLDEVGELPPDIQVKLLRALQEGEIDPIGAKKPIRVNFRLISATNKPLLDMTRKGAFREDLYYRLNVFPIWIPPLRERKQDIPELAHYFLHRFAAEEGRKELHSIDQKALSLLMEYDWPGNIRQLENALFRAVILSEGDKLTLNDFPQLTSTIMQQSNTSKKSLNKEQPSFHKEETIIQTATTQQDHQTVITKNPEWTPNSPTQNVYGENNFLKDNGEMKSISQIEEEIIRFAINHCKGRMTEVAKKLNMGRSTLYRKIKEYKIDVDDKENNAA